MIYVCCRDNKVLKTLLQTYGINSYFLGPIANLNGGFLPIIHKTAISVSVFVNVYIVFKKNLIIKCGPKLRFVLFDFLF